MNMVKYDDCRIYSDTPMDILYKRISAGDYKILKVFKDDQRSYVALLEINGEYYVYKEPREKNRRKWQRFLSIFRGSESRREYKNIKKIKELGFNSATPYMAVEKRKGPFVVDSYYVSSYIDGCDGSVKNIDIISEELRKIHAMGYLHGDSHVANFMIKDGEVYIIDTKFMFNKYGGFGRVFEFIYLEESCRIPLDYDKKSIYYKAAMVLKRYLLWLGDVKKKIRGKK